MQIKSGKGANGAKEELIRHTFATDEDDDEVLLCQNLSTSLALKPKPRKRMAMRPKPKP